MAWVDRWPSIRLQFLKTGVLKDDHERKLYRITGLTDLAKVLSEEGLDGLGNAVALLINEAMKIERARH